MFLGRARGSVRGVAATPRPPTSRRSTNVAEMFRRSARLGFARRCAEVEPPDWLTCPLSKELFDDPVVLPADGRTYERARIVAWLDDHGSSPFTRSPATGADVVSNRNILEAADAFRAGAFRC